MFEMLRRYGVTRGFLGGSRAWMVVGGIAYAIKAVRWTFKRDVEVVAVGELKPGQRLLITTIPPPAKRRRRR